VPKPGSSIAYGWNTHRKDVGMSDRINNTNKKRSPAAKALRDYRKRLGVSQASLSRATGVLGMYISAIERDEYGGMSVSSFFPLAKETGIPEAVFILSRLAVSGRKCFNKGRLVKQAETLLRECVGNQTSKEGK